MTDFFILAVAVFATILAARSLIMRWPEPGDASEEAEVDGRHG
ncbi:MAG: hypothetical protein AAF919_01245 [Pseudomonadota bacterium]